MRPLRVGDPVRYVGTLDGYMQSEGVKGRVGLVRSVDVHPDRSVSLLVDWGTGRPAILIPADELVYAWPRRGEPGHDGDGDWDVVITRVRRGVWRACATERGGTIAIPSAESMHGPRAVYATWWTKAGARRAIVRAIRRRRRDEQLSRETRERFRL